ncbi:Pentatricopeptide repeat (PPR) superfamily protein [Rhynchospora pubera]|uniref:Pentatricopeptide repeat (PPR) superfamily protein n=1 Tax=Rhynchospora pubera TaxID=906938 RepID=A0AAV8DEV6_9POAL|nr:Pentatricopeptide repeat (PPR) superfamily protein [Rhynchospora pubera]
MAVLIRSCSSTTYVTNLTAPFQNPSIRRKNKLRRLGSSPMPNHGSICSFDGLMCKVASCVPISDISTKEKLDTTIWSHEIKFCSNVPIKQSCSTEKESKSQADSKRKDVTLHFLEETDEKTLSKRLVALSRSNKTRSAFELYLSMEAFNLTPDAHACNSLLSCLLRNGSLPDALEVFDKMSRRNIATGHTFTLVIKAIGKNKGYDAAISLFNKLERDDGAKGKLDAIVYNTMFSIYAKSKDCVEAEKLWRELGKNSIKGTQLTYDLLISTFVQCNCADLAVEAYHESIQFGFEPSEATMKAIIATCTQEGNWEVALVVLRKMLDRGIKPNLIAFNSVINCLGKACQPDLAFSVYRTLNLSGLQPDMYTWYSLLSALYRSNRYLEVIKLFQWVKREAKLELDSHVYNVALLACQKQGLWAQALQLLWDMEKCEVEVSTQSYNHVIFACEDGGEVEVAFEVYRHMVQLGCYGDDFTFMSLIRCSISGSLWDEFLEILKHHIPSDASAYYSTHELCLQGMIGLAKNICVAMLKLGFKPDAKTRTLMLQHF